jgi:circadian clock protein KaiC
MSTSLPPALVRVPSGIDGLDRILGGGFFSGGAYIIHGNPGSGKTIFANQLCFNHVERGGSAVYVTLMTESHSRMLQQVRQMSFFVESVIPTRLSYISAFSDLEADGLKGLMSVLAREMRNRKASMLILDGLVAAVEAAESARQLKKFIHEIQSSAVFNDCTIFLLTSGNAQHVSAEHTMVDGLIDLEDRLFDARAERSLHVRKFRGAAALDGRHSYRITGDGLKVFPRIEALVDETPPEQNVGSAAALSTGSTALDGLISVGGLPANSSTLVVGASGTGKTTLALQFLSASSPDEPGLYFGFFESPARTLAKGRALGLPLERLQSAGALTLAWHPQAEHLLDELAHRLLEMAQSLRIKRLVIDGLAGFFESAVYPERSTRFFSCLANELRRLGATVLMTAETREEMGSSVSTPLGISGFVDNQIVMRLTNGQGQARRLLSIAKMRDSDFDPRPFSIGLSKGGLLLTGPFSTGVGPPSASPGAAPVPADHQQNPDS